MKKMIMSVALIFFFTATNNYSVNWQCCLFFFVKEKKQEKKNISLGASLHSGGEEELQILHHLEKKSVKSERLATSSTSRKNSDLEFVFVVAENLPNQDKVPRDGTSWQTVQMFPESASKVGSLTGTGQESQTSPLPHSQTQEANLVSQCDDSDKCSSDQRSCSDESFIEAVVNSKERFRHLSSDEFVHSPKVTNFKEQTNSRVTFLKEQ